MKNRVTIESPWTNNKYVIRELDPAILSIFAKPETPEVKSIRLKIKDLQEDIDREIKRQEVQGVKDESKIEALEAQLNTYINKLNELLKPDEKEIENRFKIVKYGLIEPKINSIDDYLDLGKDGTFVYSSIVALSQIPDNYADVIQSLFRQGEHSSNKGGKNG
ncbi:MAG: hypothetical protein KatS3mg003_0985 [Candidatus Nitrosocaldaceae archaeon]|nr:MAG: hypothetical protein KatS3mg003_0985 [Candidatus Nitrosocaldaceae archaeon]